MNASKTTRIYTHTFPFFFTLSLMLHPTLHSSYSIQGDVRFKILHTTFIGQKKRTLVIAISSYLGLKHSYNQQQPGTFTVHVSPSDQINPVSQCATTEGR